MRNKAIILLTGKYIQDYLELSDYEVILITTQREAKLYNVCQFNNIETVYVPYQAILEETDCQNVAILEDLITEVLQAKNLSSSQVRVIADREKHILMAGALRDRLNMPGLGYEKSQLFHNKILMKRHLQSCQIDIPNYVELDNNVTNVAAYFGCLKKKLGCPFIIKPKDESGGAHFSKINHLADFKEAYAQTSEGCFLAEEYIDGRLFQCDSVNMNGEPIITYCSQLFFSPDKFCNGETAFCIPISPSSSIASRIAAFNRQIIQTLGKVDGVTHLEVFVTKTGAFYPLEIAARCPGSEVVGCYQKSYDTNLRVLNCQAVFGNQRLVKQSNQKPRQPSTRSFLALFPKKNSGTVEKIMRPEIVSEYKLNSKIKKGDIIQSNSECISDCAATMVVENTNYEYLIKDMNYLRYFDLIDYS